MTHAFPYLWKMADGYPAPGIRRNGLKVFGTFICGGGSTMGYKLAGYDHLGGVEIDPKIAEIYETNHHPLHLYVEDLRSFNQRTDLPDELFALDILDGSPPCTTFSMNGKREATWGKEKIFAEGQARQTLDDLVFVYCDTIAKLKPKTFILENVKGLALGNAKSYLKRIVLRLRDAGYVCQVFLLNGATMGVPQKRERCFVVGRRQDLGFGPLSLSFDEPVIPFGKIIDKTDMGGGTLSSTEREAYEKYKRGDKTLADTKERTSSKKSSGFSCCWLEEDKVANTIVTSYHLLTSFPRRINEKELLRAATFPEDYKYTNYGRLLFLTGMSVPPVMRAQIAHQMDIQWFNKLN